MFELITALSTRASEMGLQTVLRHLFGGWEGTEDGWKEGGRQKSFPASFLVANLGSTLHGEVTFFLHLLVFLLQQPTQKEVVAWQRE